MIKSLSDIGAISVLADLMLAYMETIEQQAKLTEKHEMIIKQQTTPAKDLIES